jgi:hypothetical protein
MPARRPVDSPQGEAFRFLLFIASLILAGLVRNVYRPWAYQNEIGCLLVADWGPSLFFIFGMAMLIAALITRVGRLRHLKVQAMAGVLAGALFYEISQLWRADRWFSWEDAIATIVGGLGAILVEMILASKANRSALISTAILLTGIALLIAPADCEGQLLLHINEQHAIRLLDAIGLILVILGWFTLNHIGVKWFQAAMKKHKTL